MIFESLLKFAVQLQTSTFAHPIDNRELSHVTVLQLVPKQAELLPSRSLLHISFNDSRKSRPAPSIIHSATQLYINCRVL